MRPEGASPPDAAAWHAEGARLFARGRYREAEAASRRAVDAARSPPRTDALLAQALGNLGQALLALGRVAEAVDASREAVATFERLGGRDEPAYVVGLSNLAFALHEHGALAEARTTAERAVTVAERISAADERTRAARDGALAAALNNLAMVELDLGHLEAAEAGVRRAVALRTTPGAPDTAALLPGLGNLAAIAELRGHPGEARAMYERALALARARLGEDHPGIGPALCNLAHFLASHGAADEAAPLLERAISIAEAAAGPASLGLAVLLGNLADVRDATGRGDEALGLELRALSIREAALGGEHPDVAASLARVGIEMLRRDDARADTVIGRALAIRRRVYGPAHPETARSMILGAYLVARRGFHDRARAMLEGALRTLEATYGPTSTELLPALSALTVACEEVHATTDARAAHLRLLAIVEAGVRTSMQGLDGGQRLDDARAVRHHLARWLAFAPRVGQSGYAEVLRFKGLVARVEAAERALLRRGGDGVRAARDRLHAAGAHLGRLVGTSPGLDADARATWQRALAEAGAARERAALAFAAAAAGTRGTLERLGLSLEDVQRQLARDEALVDVLVVDGHYRGWIVRDRGAPDPLDFGAVAPIDEACAAFATLAADPTTTPTSAPFVTAGRRLYELVWQPIAWRLGDGVARVVLCPDAALATVPFAALPGRTPGRWLGDDVALSLVEMAQDLVPDASARATGTGALLVGDVDFEDADGASPPGAAAPRPLGGASTSSFAPIPGTRAEIAELAARFGAQGRVLDRTHATEAAVAALARGRRWIHVATHGFVRTDALAGLRQRRVREAWVGASLERQLARGHDPLLLAGLALAGANARAGGGDDDGILTALEASHLDLDGVELVTLSACETGRGTPEGGEGILGLQHALRAAGARCVVASLWPVDDEATRRWMEVFYARLLAANAPLAPPDAAREATRALRAMQLPGGRSLDRPAFAAAFVCYGR